MLADTSSLERVFNERSSCKMRLAYPVSMRKTPTPPIHPTRMCLGKNPIRFPSLKEPRRKKVVPE